MEMALEDIALGDQSRSQSHDFLTESTIFSLSRSESLWTTASRSAWETYNKPIIVMSVGGAVLIFGMVLSGLWFGSIYPKSTNILGPGFFSIGLMILVIGLVWVPVMREKQKQKSVSRLFTNHKHVFLHL
ncbi:UNVERIFIED_CONTAM: hypothetical protein FKN15_063951 [Acipenser sinensis]|uniref:Phosphoinositide-interacting protein n=1 Tax=Huso huso TaxID=61971 RepID=A0ABR0Z1L5_HUSHU